MAIEQTHICEVSYVYARALRQWIIFTMERYINQINFLLDRIEFEQVERIFTIYEIHRFNCLFHIGLQQAAAQTFYL